MTTKNEIVSVVRDIVSGYCPICLIGYNSNWEINRCLDNHAQTAREGFNNYMKTKSIHSKENC